MLLGYKQEFAEPILNGLKIHTLRKHKRKPKLGETLFMYTGLRTPDSKPITHKHSLKGTQKVWIKISCNNNLSNATLKICVNGKALSPKKTKEFCINDGFTSVFNFMNYWIDERGGILTIPFKIVRSLNCYHWTDFRY